MRDDFVRRVTFIDRRLEDLHALARDLRAAQPANQLFALSGKHRTDHHFDPAHVAFDNVHPSPPGTYDADPCLQQMRDKKS
jgi:hypothetical protein